MILENITLLDEFVQQFVSRDFLKPNMQKASLVNGFIVATNGYILIKVKQHLLAAEYSTIDGFPDAEKILNNSLLEEPIIYDKENLRKSFEKYKVIPLYDIRECNQCDGDGYQECDLGHEHDCEKCNGRGEIKGDIIGDQFEYKKGEGDYFLSNGWFNPNYIFLLVKCSDILGELTIKLISGKEQNHAHIFQIGEDVTIIVMPAIH